MEFEQLLTHYARVLVRRGVNLKPGQGLYLEMPAAGDDLAAAIVAEARAAGGGPVICRFKGSRTEEAFLAAGSPEQDGAWQALMDDCARKGMAFLRVEEVQLGSPAGVSAAALEARSRDLRGQRVRWQQLSGGVQACIACLPTAAWAEAVYPELPADAALEALWQAVFACTRADQPDPVAAWDAYIAHTTRRKALLDERDYRLLRYQGPGTDLTAAPQKGGRWQGGCMTLADGTVYVPNIPTEEIFRAPDRASANGLVRATLPLNVQGALVRDFWFRFEGGKVVEHGSAEGAPLLTAMLDTDQGARYLGEMALIDQTSPMARLGRVFYTSLYDENASCHLAVGMSAGPKPADPAALAGLGLNASAIHVDFMVGSDELNVSGQRPDGSWEPILTGGRWAPAFAD